MLAAVPPQVQAGLQHPLSRLSLSCRRCLLGGETYTWYTSKRLQHFKDRLHGGIKEDLGASYESLFKDTPFIQHGLPGTTRKLHCWCTSLTRAVNEESFSKQLLVLVLSFLDTPRYS